MVKYRFTFTYFFLEVKLCVIMLISNELNGFSPYLQLQGTNGIGRRVVWGQMGGGVIIRWFSSSASGWLMPVSTALKIGFVERLHSWWLCPHSFKGQHWGSRLFLLCSHILWQSWTQRRASSNTQNNMTTWQRSGEERKEKCEREEGNGRKGGNWTYTLTVA